MTHGRTPRFLPRIGAALGALILAVGLGVVASAPAQAEPDIDEVEQRVQDLYHEAEQASERYNDARLELAELRRELGSLKSDQGRQGEQLDAVRDRLADSVVRQYEGQDLSAAGEVLLSKDPGSFLSQLATLSAFDDFQQQLYGDYQTELEALGIRQTATQRRADRVAELKDKLADEKAMIDEKHSKAEELLQKLEAEQREAVSRSGDRDQVPTNVPTSGRAGAAIKYAMSKVGGPYSYGGAGPTAFDCSGLTMMAWRQAGVSLPHSSRAQYSSGPRVSTDQLQPGDLVFYYSPISHVGMYIGGGNIVHAANPGAGIRVSPLHSMPYVGAVRPG